MAGNTEADDDATTQNTDDVTQVFTGDDAAEATAEELERVAEMLESVDGAEMADAETETLARLRQAVKSVEDNAEDARKEAVEAELEERVDVDDSVDVGDNSTLSRVEAHSKFVPNEDGALLALEAAGVDAREVMSVKPKKVAQKAEEAGLSVDVLVSEASYTYFR